MSIWTELLFLHGHIATSAALALIAPAPPAAAPAPPAQPCDPPDDAGRRPTFAQHPLRTVGQLP